MPTETDTTHGMEQCPKELTADCTVCCPLLAQGQEAEAGLGAQN